MTFPDLMTETYSALSANKIRSFLTALGIMIGIASVIAMISIGQGAKGSITSSIESTGSNLIMIMPGAQRNLGTGGVNNNRGSAKTLTNSDYESLKDISSVKNITAELSNRYQVLAKGTNSNTTVVGTDENYLGVRNVEIETGNFITEQNLKSSARLAVLGPTTANDLFGTDDPIGQTIKINSLQFKVIGVTRVKGGSGFNNQDDIIFIPLTTNQKFLTGENYVSRIDVQVENTEQMTNVQNEISTRLLERHKIIDPTLADFNILNQSEIGRASCRERV